ncbi:DUF3601 domain-containing protein [Devosia sp. 2618]|uniref:DUF3601 domain-containing protein n=1 Tax=Devosia sp. 2618 TaxID=3156454 RepID=UPI00339979C7
MPKMPSELCLEDYRHLRVGQGYRVAKSFVDYDGIAHAVGSEWVFQGSSFVPYYDGLKLFFSVDGHDQLQTRLQLVAEEQSDIVHHSGDYLVPQNK